MSEEEKPKKKYSPAGGRKADTFMPVETTGNFKRDNPFHMSINELIAWKETGQKPKLIMRSEEVFNLAKAGISMKNIAGVYSTTEMTILDNPAFLSAFNDGRAECGSRVRAMIYQHAEAGNLNAAIHLDKLLSGEIQRQEIKLELSTRPAGNISDAELIESIEFDDGEDNLN